MVALALAVHEVSTTVSGATVISVGAVDPSTFEAVTVTVRPCASRTTKAASVTHTPRAEIANPSPDSSTMLSRRAKALGAEFILPLSSGPVYERFAGASVQGIGALAGVMVPVATGIEARLLVEYARFFSSFQPEQGDAYVASGAIDQYLGLRLAGAYIY